MIYSLKLIITLDWIYYPLIQRFTRITKEINQQNYNYSTYIGNEININNKVFLVIDFCYQNNKKVLKELEVYDTRFELHQTISMCLKPSIRYNSSSFKPYHRSFRACMFLIKKKIQENKLTVLMRVIY